MTDPFPSKATCPVCETPDGDHLDWCTPQAREQRPSKDVSSQMRSHRLIHELRTALSSTRGPFSLMDKAADEIERLQRQQTNLIAALGEAQAKIDELSIHAEKRATTPGSLATKLGHVLVNRGIYDRMKDLTQEDTAERVVSDFLALANPIVSEQLSWYGGVNQARELAASAYQDGYGEALTDDRDLSERTHELMRQLSRPAHEREGPHCSTCSCGMPPDDARSFKVGDEVPIAHWGETSKIVSIHYKLENGETIDCANPFDQAKAVFAGKKGDGYLLKMWFDTQEDLDRAFDVVEGVASEPRVLQREQIRSICHALTGQCVMVTDPGRPPCDFDNCMAMKAAARAALPPGDGQ